MEETVIDPILSKLNGKLKSTPVAEEDPILKKLNASKKKESSVESQDGENGTKEPGSTDLPTPVTKDIKPSEKPTEESPLQKSFDEWSTKRSSEYQKQYEADLNKEIDKKRADIDADLRSKFKPGTKEWIDQVNKNEREIYEFSKKRSEELLNKVNIAFKDESDRTSRRLTNQYNNKIKSEEDKGHQQLLKDTETGNFGIKKPVVEELAKKPLPSLIPDVNKEKAAKQVVKSFQEEITGKREYDGLMDETTQKLAAIPPSFNKGVVSALTAIPKGVGILAQKLDQLTGEPPKSIEEYATYQLGDFLEKKAQEIGITAIDQMNAGFVNSTVPMAFGSMVGMILSGGPKSMGTSEIAINAPKGILGNMAKTLSTPMAVSGALQASVPEFEAAKAAGKSDEEAFNVFLKNIPGGLTESMQIANMFGRLNRMTNNGLVNAIKLSGANGFEEAAQEAVQGWLTNIVAKGSYDPERDLSEGLAEGAGAGFFVGFMMPGIMAAMDKMTPEDKAKTQEWLKETLKAPSAKPTTEVIQDNREAVKSTVDPGIATSAAQIVEEFKKDPEGTIAQATGQEVKITEMPVLNVGINDKGGVSVGLMKNDNGAVWNVNNNYKFDRLGYSEDDVNKLSQAEVDGILQNNIEKPIVESSAKLPETTGETTVTDPEIKSPEAPVQEEQGIDQGADMEFTSTVGENYVKRDNRWYVKDAEGIERPLISDNPNKTQEEQNTELAQLKELKTQLETETPVKADLSPTGKSRIAELEAFSPEGRVRKWLFGGGQLLWNSKSQGEGKPKLRGLKDETGYSNKERQDIKQYVHDTKGISVEQAAEQLAAQYQDRSPQEYRNAIIEVFSSDPKTWHEQQVRDEDPEYALQEEQRFQEAGQLNEQIKKLETQEEGVKETNQQLYENERRVNYGSPAAEGQGTGSQMASPGSGGQAQIQPRESIRKNGDANKSKQALAELQTKNLTHVPGLGMGQNQAKGTYVSTEDQNRYETEDNKPVKVKVNIQKPFVSEGNVFYDIQREIIQSRFGKNAIEDLTDTELDLLAEMVTEHFTTEGFDSIYMPQSESQEGELIVFDRSKVTIMDDARIEYENAVHASTQTTLQLEFVPDAEFLKTDKPIELREKQKKIRKDLARLNQLIKCR